MNESKDKDVTGSAPLPGDGRVNLAKAGGGTLDLTSATAYEGTTYIECGTLVVRDQLKAPAVQLGRRPRPGFWRVLLNPWNKVAFSGVCSYTDGWRVR